MEKRIQRQSKALKLLSLFSDKKLEKITEDNFSFKKMTKRDCGIFMECVWVILGKEQATKIELGEGIKEVLVLTSLELFRRKGLVFINKKGNVERTKIGEEVLKELEKRGK